MKGKDDLVEAICSSLICGNDISLANNVSLIQSLGAHEQRFFLYSLLRVLSKRHLSTFSKDHNDKQQEFIRALGGAGALISHLVKDSVILKDALADWLTGASGDGISQESTIRRAVVAALSGDHGGSISWGV